MGAAFIIDDDRLTCDSVQLEPENEFSQHLV